MVEVCIVSVLGELLDSSENDGDLAGLGDYEGRAVATTQSFLKAAYITIPTVRPFLHSLGNRAFIICYSREH